MKREDPIQLEQQSSPADSNRNSSSIRSRPVRGIPIKNGTIIRNPIRLLSQHQTLQEQEAKQKITKIQYEKYGFEKTICEEEEEKIKKVLEQSRQFGRNPDRENMNWQQLWNDIKIIRTQQNIILTKKENQCFLSTFKESSLCEIPQKIEKSTIKVKNQEYKIWQGVNELQEQMRSGDCFPGLSGLIQFKINEFLHSFYRVMERIQKQKQKLTILPEIEEINRNYTKQLVLKTFNYGISSFDIDQLTYFKLKEHEEGHSKTVYKPIQNLGEWVQFVSKRRNKKRKADRFLLHTACQTCLSPHVQDCNPIITCPECHLRNHYLCLNLNVVERCGRCIYSRLSKEVKTNTSECFLCSREDLTPIRINYNLFAHGFCLLANNLWDLKQGKLNMDEGSQQGIQQLKEENCDICKKPNKFIKKCDHCINKYHPVCAFLEGYSMKIIEGQHLSIDCSDNSMKKTRCYILNFEQMVFKRLNQLKKKGVNLKI